MKDLEDENGGSPYTMVMPNLDPEVQNVILDQEAFRLKKTIPFSGEFEPQAFPKDEKEYEIYMQNTLSFIKSRTQRIMQQIPRD